MSARLWEIDHPYHAADCEIDEYDSFEELRHAVDRMDEDMNFIYRWDWYDAAAAHNDRLYLDDEARTEQHLTVTMVMQRKSRFWAVRCPIRHDQEADVLEWLHSERVAGHLRKTWAPILDANDAGAPLDLSNIRSDIAYWRYRALAAERHVERLEVRS
jgi:hypothetical protein